MYKCYYNNLLAMCEEQVSGGIGLHIPFFEQDVVKVMFTESLQLNINDDPSNVELKTK